MERRGTDFRLLQNLQEKAALKFLLLDILLQKLVKYLSLQSSPAQEDDSGYLNLFKSILYKDHRRRKFDHT